MEKTDKIPTINGFPSDFLSPEIKASKEYSLRWAESMERIGTNGSENGFFPGFMPNSNINKYAVWRAYARGQQSIDKYKPSLGVNEKKTRNDPGAVSYRVLNWEILDVISKHINVLIGKLLKQNNDIGVMAVDKRAADARRNKRMELQDHVMNGDFYDDVTKKTGIPFQKPEQEDVIPPPSNHGEIDVFMQMFYKEDYCLIVQDLLKVINEGDNINFILSEVARDLIEIGCAVTKVYRVRNKIVRRKCTPERMGVSSSNKSNFEDIKWIYEDWDMTIGQFKEIAGDQLTEEEYRDIAEKATNSNFNNFNIPEYHQQNMCYPWDNTKITVKDCVWFSPDWKTEQVAVNSFGNIEIEQRSFEWWKKLADKGVSEESFNQVNKSKVIRYPIDNQYQCMWVKNTKYVVNYGLSKDMLKNESTLGQTIGPFTAYKMKKCMMETVITTLDNIQINWMQYQHHIAKSVPAGPAIEFTALQDISLEGASGKKLSPYDALKIYFETGVLLWRRRDAAGNISNFKPIEQMEGGISNAAETHFNFIIKDLNLLRDQIGLNELTDASTPNSEMGKAVASMASGATDDALRPLHFAFDQINMGTHKRTVMHISGMAATGIAPAYVEALGLSEMAVIGLLSDLSMHELGVYVVKQPTQEMNDWWAKYCDSGIKSGSLLEEEAFEIQNEPNIYRRIRLLKMYRQQKRQSAQQAEAQAAQVKAQNDIQAAQAASQFKMDADAAANEGATSLAWEEAKAQAWLSKQQVADKAFLLNLESKNARGEAFSEEEQRRITELMKIDHQGNWNLQIAKAKPKPSPSKK